MIKSVFDRYDTVIFDMDGVITSEEMYWNAAALTVYEYINSSDYFGKSTIIPKELEKNVSDIRNTVFFGDKLIEVLKGKGVNSNWDLAYVTILIWIITESLDADIVLNYACGLSEDIISEYKRLSEAAAAKKGVASADYERNGKLWREMQSCFQEWYLGDASFFDTYKKQPICEGKSGLIKSEQPIMDISDIDKLLSELSKTKRLCIGTGRVDNEIIPTLKAWNVLKYFAKDGLSTYSYVIEAEKKTKDNLTKPNPYMFLKALYGTDYPDCRILDGDYDSELIKSTLVVGDAGADILAAKAMGADFCAVLTGVSGEKARKYFEEQNAEYILSSVINMMEEN